MITPTIWGHWEDQKCTLSAWYTELMSAMIVKILRLLRSKETQMTGSHLRNTDTFVQRALLLAKTGTASQNIRMPMSRQPRMPRCTSFHSPNKNQMRLIIYAPMFADIEEANAKSSTHHYK